MKITIFPNKITGTVSLPSSKSTLHRAIIAAGLAEGESRIHQVTFNDDTFYTLKAFEKWGISSTYHHNTLTIIGQPTPIIDEAIIDCGESGSTLRFIIPLFSKLKQTTYIGKKSLFTRPLDVYQTIYHQQELTFNLQDNSLITGGQIKAGEYKIDNLKSSQFISGLLYYLPLLEGDSSIEVNHLVSKPYLDLTLDFLKHSNIKINVEGNKIIIPGRQKYQPFEVSLEGDLSQIGYFLTLGALSGPITINNINFNSHQGDKKIIDLFISIGANIAIETDRLTIYKSKLTNFTYDLQDTPDLGLLLFALASCIKGTSIIQNIARLKYKESDRLDVGLKIITALGASFELFDNDNSIKITGNQNPKTIPNFDSYQDHRVVFTLASISPLLQQPLTITNANVVTKSYPHFWKDFKKLGGVIHQ